jgi:hypothetical protein
MKMMFVMNGSRKRTLDSFTEKKEAISTFGMQTSLDGTINHKREELGKTQEKEFERQLIHNYFKTSMVDRLLTATKCSSCGK